MHRTPHRLLSFRGIFGLFLVAVALVVASACAGSRPGDWKFGEALALRVPETAVVDAVSYTQDGKNYVVHPTQEGNKLYIVRVVVVNSRSNFQSLQVASSSVQLLGQSNLEWPALDPFEAQTRQEAESPPADLGKYAPFVWGVFDLPQGYQVDGWLLFEVPAGTKPRGLRWDTGDTVLLDL